jgi:hypothetical protein
LGHVLIEKVEQLFLDMLERHSSVPCPSRKKSALMRRTGLEPAREKYIF